MSDLVKRLRDDVGNRFNQTHTIRHEAAERIEELEKKFIAAKPHIKTVEKYIDELEEKVRDYDDLVVRSESTITELEGVVIEEAQKALDIEAKLHKAEAQLKQMQIRVMEWAECHLCSASIRVLQVILESES